MKVIPPAMTLPGVSLILGYKLFRHTIAFEDGHAGSKYSDMAPSFCGFYSFSTTSCRPFVDWPGIFMLISITIFFTQPSEAMS